MNAEMLIKARKVFVEDNIVENSEDCPHCKSKGLQKKLRYFYLSLEEKIYKCENSTCLYPFQQFMFKSLVDNSVYYYEEVVDDGGRELYFKVPLDRQNDFQSPNPISTQLFCDNQRNPSIEDYNCDFSDFFNDIDTDDVEIGKPKLPSSAENPDALEFLDEINSIDTSFGRTESSTQFDSLIDEIFNGTPTMEQDSNKMPPPAQPSSQKLLPYPTSHNVTDNALKEQPKLLKCTKHLEKVKKAQIRKTSEKSKHPFTAAILKARKSRTKAHSESASTDEEAEIQPVSEQKPNTTPRPSSPTGFLKTANNLRPTELARKLSSLKSINTSSEFLRRFMKAKEEKLFAAEIAQEKANQIESDTKKTLAPPNQSVIPNPNTVPIMGPSVQPIVNAAPAKANATKKPPTRKSMKKEPPANTPVQNDGEVKKKERKPRAKKQNVVAKDANDTVETVGGLAAIATKKTASAKRKSVNENSATESSQTGLETLGQHIEVPIKNDPKKNSRKRKVASVVVDGEKSKGEGNNESVGPVKRQRKPKCNKSDETKPKRGRATKPRVDPIKLEQPSTPLFLNDDGIGVQIVYTTSAFQPEILPLLQESEQARLHECNVETKLEPSTSQSQSTMETVNVHSVANVWNPCLTAGSIQIEPISTNSNAAPDNTNDSNVCIIPVESTVPIKRQRKPKYGKDEQIYSVETKSQRCRTPKPKTNPIKMEQLEPSLPALDDMHSEPVLSSSSQPKTKRKPVVIKKIVVVSKVKPTTHTAIEHSAANDLVYQLGTSSEHTEKMNSDVPSENVVTQQSTSTADLTNESGRVEPAKKQRRSKYGRVVNPVPVEIKPKRARTPKPKGIPIKIEQPSLPLLIDIVTDAQPNETIETARHQFTYSDSNKEYRGRIEFFENGNDITMSLSPNKDTAAEPKSMETPMSQVVGSAKRQRKPKGASDAKEIRNDEIKPKRSRVTKSKANPIKTEPASATILNEDDVAGSPESKSKTIEIIHERPEPELSESESKVEDKSFEVPSTSQMNAIGNHSAEYDSIALVAADSEEEYLSVQPCKSTYGRNSNQIVQVKREPVEYDESRKTLSNEHAHPYYRRKVFKKEQKESFRVDSLLDEWDDDSVQHPKGRATKDAPHTSDPNDMDDVISITSGATDSSFEFVGEPYIDTAKYAAD